MSYNEFYPHSETMSQPGMWQIGLVLKIEEHLRNAKSGDALAESKLCNRIGQVRRHFPTPNTCPAGIMDAVKPAVDWLRSTGRKIDLQNNDPRMWISNRSGNPRW